MKFKQTGKLAPANKPWQLIRDAVGDLVLQEQCKSVHIDMISWHTPLTTGKCSQCLAGCVMSRRLGASSSMRLMPNSFNTATRNKLRALNAFRRGAVGTAYNYLCVELPSGLNTESIWIRPYDCYPKGFKRDMLALADQLEAAHKIERHAMAEDVYDCRGRTGFAVEYYEAYRGFETYREKHQP